MRVKPSKPSGFCHFVHFVQGGYLHNTPLTDPVGETFPYGSPGHPLPSAGSEILVSFLVPIPYPLVSYHLPTRREG